MFFFKHSRAFNLKMQIIDILFYLTQEPSTILKYYFT